MIKEAKIFGIINLTPDSFSDKGANFSRNNALQTAEGFLEEGVYAIDIGAESTRLNAEPVLFDEEIKRLSIALPEIVKMGGRVSVDTRNYETARWALDKGACIINDVSGLRDENMIKLVKEYNIEAIFMHSLAVPHSNSIFMKEQDEEMLKSIIKWAVERLQNIESYGISKEKLIFDPGNGFGKKAEQSLFIMQNIQYFERLGVRILMGHSRKSFLAEAFKDRFLQGEPSTFEKDLMTTIFSIILFKKIDFLRIHNVKMLSSLKDFLK